MSVRRRMLPAGWYPKSADECQKEINGFLDGFNPPEGHWIAGVAPHAGWAFSGLAAAKVVKTLSLKGDVDRVVVFGGHLPGGYAPIAYVEDGIETPFGVKPIDMECTLKLVNSGQAVAAGSDFSDNTIEVQLPLVSYFFPNAKFVAVHSPSSEEAINLARNVKTLLDEKGLSAVFLGSADLTHYGPNYGFSPKGTGASSVKWVKEENDQILLENAVHMRANELIKDASIRHNTCSAGPIASIIEIARLHGVNQGKLLDYYTSYDVMPGSSFVGYASIVY
jgi:MEMO1 family protein